MQVTKPWNLKRLLTEDKCAVIVVDVQNDFCAEEGFFAKAGADMSAIESIIDPINLLVDTAHEKNIPVVFIKQAGFRLIDSETWAHTGRATDMESNCSACEDGTWGNELYKMHNLPTDPILPKPRYDAFIGTYLESILKSNRVTTVIVVGVSTNVCVETTVRHACCNDYNVVVAEDGCGSWIKAAHDMTMDNISKFFGIVSDSKTITDFWKEI